MGTPDPSLGISASFDAGLFRNAITFAEQMGTHPNPSRAPMFVRPTFEQTYWKDGVELPELPPMGRDGQPLDADVEVRRADPEIIQDANCTVELERANADELPVGKFLGTKAVVTLLDVDYVKVQGCTEMRYNGDRYAYGYEADALGLFDVGIHTIIYYAIDES